MRQAAKSNDDDFRHSPSASPAATHDAGGEAVASHGSPPKSGVSAPEMFTRTSAAGIRLSGLAAYLWRKSGLRGRLALVLQIAGGLTEGISILLLVPVLTMVNQSSGAPAITLPADGVLGFGAGMQIGLPVILGALVVLVVLTALFNRLRTIFTADLMFSLLNAIRLDLVRSIAQARWSAFNEVREADLTHVLTGEMDRVQTATATMLALVQNVILIAIYFVLSVLISLEMSLLAAGVGLVMVLVLAPLRRRAHGLGTTITEGRREQYRTISDFVTGMKMAKWLNAEARSVDRLSETLERMRSNARRFTSLATWGTSGFQIFSVVALSIFVYFAVIWATMPLPELVVLLLVFMRLAPRFLSLQNYVQQILQDIPAFDAMERMKTHFDAAREQSDEPKHEAPSLDRELRVENVSFAYGGDGHEAGAPALSKIDFTLAQGEVTALIGPSGSGKSTLADILLGLLEPHEGSVSVDGVRIEGDLRRAWRKKVAFVPQHVFLIHDTIAANLRLASPDASESEMQAALETAQAWQFIGDLPSGIHTIVGDRGTRFSGGERQRIALAQALLRRPRLLVLDEATSALDGENQAAIARAIARLKHGMTIVTIAHRPSMISFADKVVALELGRMVEFGAYDELAARPDSHLARMLATEQRTDATPPSRS